MQSSHSSTPTPCTPTWPTHTYTHIHTHTLTQPHTRNTRSRRTQDLAHRSYRRQHASTDTWRLAAATPQSPGHVVLTPVSSQPRHLSCSICLSMCAVCVPLSLIRYFSYIRSSSTSEAVLSPSSYASTPLACSPAIRTSSRSQATAATRLQQKCTRRLTSSTKAIALELQQGCNKRTQMSHCTVRGFPTSCSGDM